MGFFCMKKKSLSQDKAYRAWKVIAIRNLFYSTPWYSCFFSLQQPSYQKYLKKEVSRSKARDFSVMATWRRELLLQFLIDFIFRKIFRAEEPIITFQSFFAFHSFLCCSARPLGRYYYFCSGFPIGGQCHSEFV